MGVAGAVMGRRECAAFRCGVKRVIGDQRARIIGRGDAGNGVVEVMLDGELTDLVMSAL
jgi:hypothetical protein